jgi:hypothetical protein
MGRQVQVLADGVLGAESVGLLDQFNGAEGTAVDGHRHARLELKFNVFGLVGCLLDGRAEDVDLVARLVGGVFKLRPFGRAVPEVPVAAVDALLGLDDRDAVGLGILDGRLTAGQDG